VHALRRHNLTAEQLTPQLESTRASRLLRDYLDGLKLGQTLPSTELQPADDLAILAGQVFVNIWKLTDDEAHLYNAACVLEFGLTKSKHSFKMRLLLVRIFNLLGTFFYPRARSNSDVHISQARPLWRWNIIVQ